MRQRLSMSCINRGNLWCKENIVVVSSAYGCLEGYYRIEDCLRGVPLSVEDDLAPSGGLGSE